MGEGMCDPHSHPHPQPRRVQRDLGNLWMRCVPMRAVMRPAWNTPLIWSMMSKGFFFTNTVYETSVIVTSTP